MVPGDYSSCLLPRPHFSYTAGFRPLPWPSFRLAKLIYAAITSIASTLGGIFGYLIGKRAGRPILSRFIKEENFHKIEDMFARYGGWAVAVAGFTPIPYKVFTIASGYFA